MRIWVSLGVVFLSLIILAPALASAEFYVIGGGKRYKRTVVVSPVSDNATVNGLKLLEAMDSIPGSDESNRWLVKLEPGIYDLGNEWLQMKSYVDLEGSGRDVTTIKGTSRSLVIKADAYCEIRDLTVYGDSSSDMVGVRLGDEGDAAIEFYLKDVNIKLWDSQGTWSADFYGIHNFYGGLHAENVNIDIDQGEQCIGVKNQLLSYLNNVDININRCSTESSGVKNSGQDFFYYDGGTIFAFSADGYAIGIYNDDYCTSHIVNIEEIKAQSNNVVWGVYNRGGGMISMQSDYVNTTGFSTGNSTGILNDASGGSVRVDHCVFDNSDTEEQGAALINNNSSATFLVGASRIEGGVGANVDTVYCYDETNAPIP